MRAQGGHRQLQESYSEVSISTSLVLRLHAFWTTMHDNELQNRIASRWDKSAWGHVMAEGAARMAIAFCSKSRQDIRPEHRLRLGQRFFCPNCCTEIEVVSSRPLEPDLARGTHELEGSAEDERRGKLEPA